MLNIKPSDPEPPFDPYAIRPPGAPSTPLTPVEADIMRRYFAKKATGMTATTNGNKK
jgi:hypothetical protein